MSKREWIDWCILRAGFDYPEIWTGKDGKEPRFYKSMWFDHPEYGRLLVFEDD